MTWTEFYEELLKQTSHPALADNIIGHMMDDYESWDWDDEVPDGLLELNEFGIR